MYWNHEMRKKNRFMDKGCQMDYFMKQIQTVYPRGKIPVMENLFTWY